MNDLERFHACMAYQPVDHTPFWSWGGWEETIERWQKEGYDPKRTEPADICDKRLWFGGWFIPNPPFERKVVEDNTDNVVYVNPEGILMREMKGHASSSMPQFLKFP